MKNTLGFLALLSTGIVFSDTLIIEPVNESTSSTVISDVYNADTGEYVGEQYTYDFGDGYTITEIITTGED